MSVDVQHNSDINVVNMAAVIEFLNSCNFSQDEYWPLSSNADMVVRSDISTDSELDSDMSQLTEIKSCDPAYFPPSPDSDGSDRDDSSIILEDTPHLLGGDLSQYSYDVSMRDTDVDFNYHSPPYYYANSGMSSDIFIKQEISCPKTPVDNTSRLPSFEILASSCRTPKSTSTGSRMYDSDFDDTEIESRKKKRGAKNVLLWKFLLTELATDSQAVRWVDKKQGTFRFTDTVEVSRKWGQKKHKTDMNFEKLSRGIRHYYKNKFMTRMDGVRLVYRFNWSKIPRDWRPVLSTAF